MHCHECYTLAIALVGVLVGSQRRLREEVQHFNVARALFLLLLNKVVNSSKQLVEVLLLAYVLNGLVLEQFRHDAAALDDGIAQFIGIDTRLVLSGKTVDKLHKRLQFP